jgi:hypothetical protein
MVEHMHKKNRGFLWISLKIFPPKPLMKNAIEAEVLKTSQIPFLKWAKIRHRQNKTPPKCLAKIKNMSNIPFVANGKVSK